MATTKQKQILFKKIQAIFGDDGLDNDGALKVSTQSGKGTGNENYTTV